MATKIVNAVVLGMDLWNEHPHKKGELDGLKIDNQHTAAETIKLMDNFVTDSGYTSGGSAYAAETLSGASAAVNRFQVTVPAGDCVSLGKEDCKGVEFIGRAAAVASAAASGCIITAQYHLS